MALLDDGGATQLAYNSPGNGQIQLVDAADGARTYPPIAALDRCDRLPGNGVDVVCVQHPRP